MKLIKRAVNKIFNTKHVTNVVILQTGIICLHYSDGSITAN